MVKKKCNARVKRRERVKGRETLLREYIEENYAGSCEVVK